MPSPLITAFRAKFPDYDDLPDEAVYERLLSPNLFRGAFPEYADLDDATIVRRVQRYAETGPQISAAGKKAAEIAEIEQPAEKLEPSTLTKGLAFLGKITEPLQTPVTAMPEGGFTLTEQAKKILPAPGQTTLPRDIPVVSPLARQAVGVGGRAAAGLLDYAASPLGMASIKGAALVPPAAPLIFGAQVLPGAVRAIPTAARAVGSLVGLAEAPSPEEAEQAFTSMALGSLVGAGFPAARSTRYKGWRSHYEREGYTPAQASQMAVIPTTKGLEPPPAPIPSPPAPKLLAPPPIQGLPPEMPPSRVEYQRAQERVTALREASSLASKEVERARLSGSDTLLKKALNEAEKAEKSRQEAEIAFSKTLDKEGAQVLSQQAQEMKSGIVTIPLTPSQIAQMEFPISHVPGKKPALEPPRVSRKGQVTFPKRPIPGGQLLQKGFWTPGAALDAREVKRITEQYSSDPSTYPSYESAMEAIKNAGLRGAIIAREGENIKILRKEAIAQEKPPSIPPLSSIVKKLPEGVDVTFNPRAMSRFTELFGSPSFQWGKFSPTAGHIANETARRTNRIYSAVSSAQKDMQKLWGPMSRPDRTRTMELLDDASITPRNIAQQPGVNPQMIQAFTGTRQYLDNALLRLNKARVEAGEPPLEGLAGYWPHVFPGEWMVRKQSEAKPLHDARGAPLIFENYGKALDALREVSQREADAVISPRQLFLSDPRYAPQTGKIFSNTIIMLDPLTRKPVEISALRRGRPRPGQPSFIKPRISNAPGWLDSPRALETYIAGVERYIEMEPWRAEVRKIVDRGIIQKEAPEAYTLHGALESYIDAAIVGRPGKLSSTLHDLWNDAAITISKAGPLGRALAGKLPSRPGGGATRALLLFESLAKLGLSPAAGLANALQTVTHTIPILGFRNTANAFKNLVKNPEKYKELFESLGLEAPTRAETPLGQERPVYYIPRTFREGARMTEETVSWLALWMFRKPEIWNRQIAAAGGYESALARGASQLEAIQAAQKVVQRTQFQYGIADLPRAIRSEALKVPLQFRSFAWKTIEMMLGMDKKQFTRFMLASLPVMGVRGTIAYAPAVGMLAWLLSTREEPVTFDQLDMIMRNLPSARRLATEMPLAERFVESPIGGMVTSAAEAVPGLTQVAAGGALAPAGFDVTRSMGFQEFLTPFRRPEDIGGPGGADIYRGLKAAPGLVAEARERTLTRTEDKAVADFLASTLVSVRRASQVLQQREKFPYVEPRKEIVDPRRGITLLEKPTVGEKAGLVYGVQPSRLSDVYARENIRRESEARSQDVRGGYQDAVVRALLEKIKAQETGNSVRATEAGKEATRLFMEAAQKGIPLTVRGIEEGLTTLKVPRELTTIRNAPLRLRLEFLRLMPKELRPSAEKNQ